MSNVILKIRRCPQVWICAVNGAAAGAGFSLALATDVRLCVKNAKFNAGKQHNKNMIQII
jgi:enoyl-CoA hydratase